MQYADYAVWQRQWLTGAVLERELAYWRQHLAGAPPALELPTDRPRPPRQSFRGGTRQRRLSAALVAAVEALGRRLGATSFMTLLAGFGTLLARYSGQDEIVLGSPISNRGRIELEPVIGLFVNTLARRPVLRRRGRAGARGGAGRLCAPGRAVRDGGRGAAAAA
jgi:hypothetical protein